MYKFMGMYIFACARFRPGLDENTTAASKMIAKHEPLRMEAASFAPEWSNRSPLHR